MNSAISSILSQGATVDLAVDLHASPVPRLRLDLLPFVWSSLKKKKRFVCLFVCFLLANDVSCGNSAMH